MDKGKQTKSKVVLEWELYVLQPPTLPSFDEILKYSKIMVVICYVIKFYIVK